MLKGTWAIFVVEVESVTNTHPCAQISPAGLATFRSKPCSFSRCHAPLVLRFLVGVLLQVVMAVLKCCLGLVALLVVSAWAEQEVRLVLIVAVSHVHCFREKTLLTGFYPFLFSMYDD